MKISKTAIQDCNSTGLHRRNLGTKFLKNAKCQLRLRCGQRPKPKPNVSSLFNGFANVYVTRPSRERRHGGLRAPPACAAVAVPPTAAATGTKKGSASSGMSPCLLGLLRSLPHWTAGHACQSRCLESCKCTECANRLHRAASRLKMTQCGGRQTNVVPTCRQPPPKRRHAFQPTHATTPPGSSTGPQRSRSSTGFHTVSSQPRTSHRHHLASYMLPPFRYSFGYTCLVRGYMWAWRWPSGNMEPT